MVPPAPSMAAFADAEKRVRRDVERALQLAAAEDLHEVLLARETVLDEDVEVDLG